MNSVTNTGSFTGGRYSQIGFTPIGTNRQITDLLGDDSLYDAIGCIIAMNAAFSAIIGRVGFA